jgi:ELWxxDGT repeat protein
MFLICRICNAQIDLQCNGRDMHSIYISGYNYDIYRVDSVDTSPTNPILLISNKPASSGGISINANLDSIAGPETMYFVEQYYYFWNGLNWTNTNHTSGSLGAVNPGGTSDFIFNLNGNGNALYRYDGTANGTLLLSNLNTASSTIYDVATDNQGNFYLFYSNLQKIIAYNSTGIPIDSFTISGLVGGGGGFAILGNRMYAITSHDLYEGIKTGSNINFTLIKSLPFSVADIATCPEAGNPLSVFNSSSLPHSIVYPNPISDKLNITISNNEPSEALLYDIASRKLFQQTFINSISIPTESLAKGIYLYEVRNKNGVIKKGKVVKPACR